MKLIFTIDLRVRLSNGVISDVYGGYLERFEWDYLGLLLGDLGRLLGLSLMVMGVISDGY